VQLSGAALVLGGVTLVTIQRGVWTRRRHDSIDDGWME
jgi:hypothetical protein